MSISCARFEQPSRLGIPPTADTSSGIIVIWTSLT